MSIYNVQRYSFQANRQNRGSSFNVFLNKLHYLGGDRCRIGIGTKKGQLVMNTTESRAMNQLSPKGYVRTKVRKTIDFLPSSNDEL